MNREDIKFIRTILTILTVMFIILFFTTSVTAQKDNDTYICHEYQEYIEVISEQYNVCPELIMAIVETESSGRSDAINGDCKGLMQISERWHKDRMERLGVTDLLDPYSNILVGVDYLMELAEQYGDLLLVLMIYNGTSDAHERMESGNYTKYATSIIDRSIELERLHGK